MRRPIGWKSNKSPNTKRNLRLCKIVHLKTLHTSHRSSWANLFQSEIELSPLTDCRHSTPPARLSVTLWEGGRCAVGTCSSGTSYGEASGGRCGAVAGLHVLRDATVGGQLVTEGSTELRKLLLGLGGGQ